MLTLRLQSIMMHNSFVAPGATLVIAVSGGTDSLALLHLLYTLQTAKSLTLHVATFDHGLRGDASAADARFVVETAQLFNLPVTVGTGDVRALAKTWRIGIEAAARRARYDFLADVARKVQAEAVVTAHHAGDQAETVLMHILRGSGTNGLQGMAVQATVPGHEDIALIRPLLATPRADLAAYCVENDLHPREDATNADTDHLRNKIRHDVMPLLRQINPQVETALLRLADIMQIDNDYLRVAFEREVAPHITHSEGRVTIDRTQFNAWHPAMQRRALQFAAAQINEVGATIGYDHITEALRIAISGGTGAISQFAGGVHLRVDYKILVIERADATPILPSRLPLLQPGQRVTLTVPGETLIPGANWSLIASHDPIAGAFSIIAPSGSPLLLRTRQPGERFATRDMKGHTRSIKKWMIDRKIPRHLRDRLPIVEINGHSAAIFMGNQWQIAENYRDSNKILMKNYLFVNYS